MSRIDKLFKIPVQYHESIAVCSIPTRVRKYLSKQSPTTVGVCYGINCNNCGLLTESRRETIRRYLDG